MNRRDALLFYKKYLAYRAFAPRTARDYLREAEGFLAFQSEEQGKDDIREITSSDAVLWLASLDGKEYRPHTKAIKLQAVKLLYKCLAAEGKILSSPVAKLAVRDPEAAREIPLSPIETGEFLDGIEPKDHKGLFDRALCELLYGSGLRISEARNLKTADVDLKERFVVVRRGKFMKERMVPVTETAAMYMAKYRQGLTGEYFFEGQQGGRVGEATLSHRVRVRAVKAGICGLSAHGLRHLFATHLLEGGADIRMIQEMLGHERLETTARYTKSRDSRLKRAHSLHHPRENHLYRQVEGGYENALKSLAESLVNG